MRSAHSVVSSVAFSRDPGLFSRARHTKSGLRFAFIGPDDGTDFGLDVPEVIRSVFRAAGGTHDDWAEFDRIMATEQRCAVFVGATKVTTNPTR